MLNTMKILIKSLLNLKLVIMSEYQNTKEVFILTKIKNTVPWTYAVSDLNGEPIAGRFYEKDLEKPVKKNLE